VSAALARTHDDELARIPSLGDDELGNYLARVEEEYEAMREMLGAYRDACKAEIERRLKVSGAKAFLHPAFETCELETILEPYRFNVKVLADAHDALVEAGKPEEAQKVAKHRKSYDGRISVYELLKELRDIPDDTMVTFAIEDHYVHGTATQIKALANKYGDLPIGKLLREGMTRKVVGERLVVKRRERPMQNVTPRAALDDGDGFE
jgi:hypothetical protein